MTSEQHITLQKKNPQNIILYVALIKLAYQTDFLKSVLVTIYYHNLNFLVKHVDCILFSLLFLFFPLFCFLIY